MGQRSSLERLAFATILFAAGALACLGARADDAPPQGPASAPAADAGDKPPAPAALPAAAAVAGLLDARFREAFRAAGATAAEPCPDAVFLRRAALDLCGSVPSPEDSALFLADADPGKRGALVRRLLDTPEAARCFAEWYGRLLLGRTGVEPRNRRSLEAFLAKAYADRMPFDRLAAALLSARGTISDDNGAAAYVGQFANDAASLAGRTARLFLGVRIACAQCHDHPFEKWTQGDFAGLAAYFGKTRLEKIPTPVDEANGLASRAAQFDRQTKEAVEKAKADLPKAEEAARAALAAADAAKKAWGPVAEQARRAKESAAKDRATAAAMRQTAAEGEAQAKEAEAAAQAAGVPKAVADRYREESKIGAAVAALARAEADRAEASAKSWDATVAKALADGAPKKAALSGTDAEAKKAVARRDEEKALVERSADVLARDQKLVDLARRLAGAVPGVYRDGFDSEGKPVPPDQFRVVDAGGKVTPRKDPAHPERGDGMPRALDGSTVAPGTDGARLRDELSTWLTAHANPFLARAAVNRFAAQLLGRGFYDPVDEVADDRPAFGGDAARTLADDFKDSGYDLRRLLEILALSAAYGADSAGGSGPETPFARAPVRELQPEVLFRALTRAMLPGLPEAGAGGSAAQRDDLVRRFAPLFDDGEDRPAALPRSGMRAALWLENGGPIANALRGRREGRASRLVESGATDEAAVNDVYLAFLARKPTDAEKAAILAAFPKDDAVADANAKAQRAGARVQILEDLEWALANGAEFLTNH